MCLGSTKVEDLKAAKEQIHQKTNLVYFASPLYSGPVSSYHQHFLRVKPVIGVLMIVKVLPLKLAPLQTSPQAFSKLLGRSRSPQT